MDTDPNIPAPLAEKLKAGFAHQPLAELDSYVLDVADSFKAPRVWWRSKWAAVAAILIVAASIPLTLSLTAKQPTVLDAFAAARAMRGGDKSISQTDVDSLLAAAVKLPRKRGGL